MSLGPLIVRRRAHWAELIVDTIRSHQTVAFSGHTCLLGKAPAILVHIRIGSSLDVAELGRALSAGLA